jgi:hypothetical protein
MADEHPAVEVLSRLLDYMDAGILIRDTSHDHESGWAMKQLPFVMTIAAARAIVDGSKVR